MNNLILMTIYLFFMVYVVIMKQMGLKKDQLLNYIKMAPVTFLLLISNIIVFVTLSFMGDTEDSLFLVLHGGQFTALIIHNKEFYRLITSVFLHAGPMHIASNMIYLVYLGVILEPKIGFIKFSTIYFLSGIGGNIIVLLKEVWLKDFYVSVGASGAIMGISGAVFYILFKRRHTQTNDSNMEILVAAIISIILIFSACFKSDVNVNNTAHLAGLVMGFMVCAGLSRISRC